MPLDARKPRTRSAFKVEQVHAGACPLLPDLDLGLLTIFAREPDQTKAVRAFTRRASEELTAGGSPAGACFGCAAQRPESNRLIGRSLYEKRSNSTE